MDINIFSIISRKSGKRESIQQGTYFGSLVHGEYPTGLQHQEKRSFNCSPPVFTFGADHAERYAAEFTGWRLSFKKGMSAICSYEFRLSQVLLDILAETPGVTVYGIKDTCRLEERVPTAAFTLMGKSPRQVAEKLDEANIFVWDGNYYALEVTTRLGLEGSGGMVRVGPVHYNTLEEIERFGEVLNRIALPG